MVRELHRRHVLTLATAGLAMPWVRRAPVLAPGVTETSIKIGQTMAYSGPAAAAGAIDRAEAAFFKMLNVGGGVSDRMTDLLAINGRMIEFVSMDDGYSPSRTVEATRRLVEAEEVALMFSGLGTMCQTAVRQYLNAQKVPQLFVAARADTFSDPRHFPWTIGWQPSYRTEAQVYARHMREAAQGAKLAVLYQNDDYGKEYLTGLRDVLGPMFDQVVVRTAAYEATDAALDGQIAALHASGADALLTAATPLFAAQAIRKVAKMGWHPALHYLSGLSSSATQVMIPAGGAGRGIITGTCSKDPSDPRWADDPGMNEWRAFMQQWMPDADPSDGAAAYGYGTALLLKRVLEQCRDDLSRKSIMHQATNLRDLEIPVLLPGIRVNVSTTDYRPIQQMQLARWTGTSWALFGEVLEGIA